MRPRLKFVYAFVFQRHERERRGRKEERRVEGRARNPRQYPVLAKRIAISAGSFNKFRRFEQAAKSTLTAMQRRGFRLSTSKRTEYPYFRFIMLR